MKAILLMVVSAFAVSAWAADSSKTYFDPDENQAPQTVQAAPQAKPVPASALPLPPLGKPVVEKQKAKPVEEIELAPLVPVNDEIELAPLVPERKTVAERVAGMKKSSDFETLDATYAAMKKYKCQEQPNTAICKKIAENRAFLESQMKKPGMIKYVSCKFVDPVSFTREVSQVEKIDLDKACGGKKAGLCAGTVQCLAVMPDTVTLGGIHPRILFTTEAVCPALENGQCPAAKSCATDESVAQTSAAVGGPLGSSSPGVKTQGGKAGDAR